MNIKNSSILKSVEKPGRYSAGEFGQIIKDKKDISISAEEIINAVINQDPTKEDAEIAKNYLSEDEMSQLERMVSAYLDLAEIRKKFHN